PVLQGLEPGRGVRPYFFFFQAEDGIRDFHVTGVQTCALPISFRSTTSREIIAGVIPSPAATTARSRTGSDDTASASTSTRAASRSEERRVGKEWRYGGGPRA